MMHKTKNPYLKYYELSTTLPPPHAQIERANKPFGVSVKRELPQARREPAPTPMLKIK